MHLQAMTYQHREHGQIVPLSSFGRPPRSVEADILERISKGELVLTGYAFPLQLTSRREVVPPQLLEVLEIDLTKREAEGPGLRLIHLKVHSAGESDASSTHLEWENDSVVVAESEQREFTHSADYGRVTIRGMAFDLSGGLCQIVARLHEASRNLDPWLNGKRLMAECGYSFDSIADAFKRHRDPCWRELIEGNRRGLFRLNLHKR